jgi:hypothetical protein
MADAAAVLDYRRTDQRKNVLANPYWITSGEMDGAAAEDLDTVLFSFPVAGRLTIVHAVMFQVTTVFTVSAGAAVCTVGIGTIATDTVTTGGAATTVTANAYILTTDITFGTAGYYMPVTAHHGAWIISAMEGTVTNAASQYIVGAASTVPVVIAYFSNAGGAISTGKARFHMLISEVPGV